MNRWYAFHADDSPTFYGYGSAVEADRYADVLNRGKGTNRYAPRAMTDAEATAERLEDRDDTVNLADELGGWEAV